MSEAQGKFVWYELVTKDVTGAIAFYGRVTGWGTQPFEGGNGYTMWTANGTPIGGVMALQSGTDKPHWFAHVTVDDVDAQAKQTKSLGGSIVAPPTDIPTIGRFSIIADPQGAQISLFKPLGPDRPLPTEIPVGHFLWNELVADDPEAAFTFYSKLLGWQKTDAVSSPVGPYQMYGKNGRSFGGIMHRPKDYPWPPHWLHYVGISDLDAALGRVKQEGGVVLNGPMEIPGGNRVAQCKDPQDALFALHGK